MLPTSTVSPRLPGEKPLSPGGYVAPWRVRLLLIAIDFAVLIPLGLVVWTVPVAIVLLIVTDIAWHRREKKPSESAE